MKFTNRIIADIIKEMLIEATGSALDFTQEQMEQDLMQGELHMSNDAMKQVVCALVDMGHVITFDKFAKVVYIHEVLKKEGVMFTLSDDEPGNTVWGYYKH